MWGHPEVTIIPASGKKMAAGITLDYFGTKIMQALKLIGIISILEHEELD